MHNEIQNYFSVNICLLVVFIFIIFRIVDDKIEGIVPGGYSHNKGYWGCAALMGSFFRILVY